MNARTPPTPGGLPPQDSLLTDRAVFTEAYAVLPRGVLRDIVTSSLPHWRGMRMWVLARPMSGFATTFSQYLVELAPGGASGDADQVETEPGVEAVLYVTDGELGLDAGGTRHRLGPGGYAYLPPDLPWSVVNEGGEAARFHWIRKAYEAVDGVDAPPLLVTREQDVEPVAMPDTDGRWATARFVDPADLRHDMHVNVVSFEPGGLIPFLETHVMEHGLYVLEGQAVYRLNRDWVEVQAGDFMWLRAFCPQACYAGGPGRFRYLLYKDVNRHVPMRPR